MSNIMQFGNAIKVGSAASAPSGPLNGTIYYDTTLSQFRKYENGAWGSLASNEVLDTVFRIVDDGDNTRKIAFQASGITGGNTRTITMPDANVNLGLIATAIQSSEKGAASGVCPLDGSSKVASTYLPSYVDDVLEYANLAAFPGTGETAKIYIALDTGKTYRWTGSAYVEIVASPGTTDAITEGSVNLYFTEARVRGTVLTGLSAAAGGTLSASDTILQAFGKLEYRVALDDAKVSYSASTARSDLIAASIVSGDTTHAPDGASVYTALAAKLSSVSQDTAPQLGGNLDLNSKVMLGKERLANSATPTNYLEREYLHAVNLTASTTAVASSLTFDSAVFEAVQIDYKIKEATSNKVRQGTLRVSTNGTDVSYTDLYNETADVGVVWSAALNVANVEISYTTTANAKVMRAEVKRFAV